MKLIVFEISLFVSVLALCMYLYICISILDASSLLLHIPILPRSCSVCWLISVQHWSTMSSSQVTIESPGLSVTKCTLLSTSRRMSTPQLTSASLSFCRLKLARYLYIPYTHGNASLALSNNNISWKWSTHDIINYFPHTSVYDMSTLHCHAALKL